MWAYELFIKADFPDRATDVPGIPLDIAERADSYALYDEHGNIEVSPYHCPASFLGEDLENLVCFTSNSRREIISQQGTTTFLSLTRRAIDSLTPAIRKFNNREKGLQTWPISQEKDVRDLLFVMLRSSIDDLKVEEPIPSRAGTHKIVDIYSSLAKLLIEVKWIGKKGQWKRIIEQISIDIQAYSAHPNCVHLIFIIIDAIRDVPDPTQVQKELTKKQTINDKVIDVEVLYSAGNYLTRPLLGRMLLRRFSSPRFYPCSGVLW